VNVFGAVLQVGAGALALILAVRHVNRKQVVAADRAPESED
jgi:hypothetical protein